MTGRSQLFSSQRGRLPKQDAVVLADTILKKEKKKQPINIIFVDDKYMKSLNARFLKKNRPTDVLAFPADLELGILGEVYVSVETARRQAHEYKITLREEILRLICHGVLHLCGYDHRLDRDSRKMKAREENYLNWFLASG